MLTNFKASRVIQCTPAYIERAKPRHHTNGDPILIPSIGLSVILIPSKIQQFKVFFFVFFSVVTNPRLVSVDVKESFTDVLFDPSRGL